MASEWEPQSTRVSIGNISAPSAVRRGSQHRHPRNLARFHLHPPVSWNNRPACSRRRSWSTRPVPATWCSGCSGCWGASSVLGSPISGARFWRIGPNADYDPLDRLSRHQDTIERIARHWEDILRIAGSPKLGIIGAAELVRSLLGYLLRKTVPESFSSHCGAHAGEILGSSVGCRRFVLDVRKLLVCCHSVSLAVSQLWVVYCHLATSNRSACQTSGFC